MSFTKVAPAGIGTSPGNSILIGDSLLHSTGIDIGSSTGVGVTIRQHGDATFTGIVTAASFSASGAISASSFTGDGSGLEGVSSSGIGTPLSDDDTSDLNKIYYTNQELSIGSTVTVNHPNSAVASYTHYQDLVVKDDADFIVTDGDTFIPDVLGILTSTSPTSAATGGRIRAGTITNAGANGAPNFPNGLTGTAGTFTGAISAASASITGNLGVGGVLTYEDVTNVDSVGVITARSGVKVTGGDILVTGADGRKISFAGDGSSHYFKMDNSFNGPVINGYGGIKFETAGTNERLRIGSVGQLGIGGANYGTSGQVLTSQGNSSAVQWATPSSFPSHIDIWRITQDSTLSSGNYLTSNWSRAVQSSTGDQLTALKGAQVTQSSGVFTFPTTGIWQIMFQIEIYKNGSCRWFEAGIMGTEDNFSSLRVMSTGYASLFNSGLNTHASARTSTFYKVSNVSNNKIKFRTNMSDQVTNESSATSNQTWVEFVRVSDI